VRGEDGHGKMRIQGRERVAEQPRLVPELQEKVILRMDGKGCPRSKEGWILGCGLFSE